MQIGAAARAGADTFEVWADVARHYALDPDLTSVAGYSMGGRAALHFATANVQGAAGDGYASGVVVTSSSTGTGARDATMRSAAASPRSLSADGWINWAS